MASNAWFAGRFRPIAGCVLAAVGLVSCATGEAPPDVTYFEPQDAPQAPPSMLVDQPVEVVQRVLEEHLREQSFGISKVDPLGQYIIAEYKGDPQPYVDCGLLVMVPSGASKGTAGQPAATANMAMHTRRGTFNRMLRLQGRLTAELEPLGNRTMITPQATYVLSREVRGAEDPDVWGAETVSFASGGQGVFDKGTTCQPTGRLESAAVNDLEVRLAALGEAGTATLVTRSLQPGHGLYGGEGFGPRDEPLATEIDLNATVAGAILEGSCAEVEPRLRSDREVVLSGIASDLFAMDSVVNAVELASTEEILVDNRIAVLSRPACEAYQLVRSQEATAAPDQLRLSVVNAGEGVLEEGDPLRFAIGIPETQTAVHISYFQSDGMVGHIELEAPWDLPENVPWFVDTQSTIGPPFGREFVLAIASEQPLFDARRPSFERAEEFMPVLREALGGAGDTVQPRLACALLVTAERGTFSSGDREPPRFDACGRQAAG